MSSSLNILMVTSHFAPRLGGVEQHVLRVSRELAGRGHHVTVLTRRWEACAVPQEDMAGIQVRRAAGGIARSPRHRHLDLLRRAEVIHCHDLYAYLRFIAPAWPGPSAPLFVTFHGYEGYPIARSARFMRRRLARRARGVICMGDFICRWYGHPCDAVSYGGVDAPDTPAPEPGGDAPALYVGRLAPDTGIMAYVEALRLLRERGRVLRLEVCGDGPLREAIRSAAAAAGLDVTLHGWVADITPLLERCRLAFVSGYLTILEAMAYRRLACSLWDNPLKRDYLELFPAAAHMLIGDGPGRLADLIARHVDDPSLAAAKVDAAEVFARQQTWARVADLYVDLYRSRGLAA